MLIETPERDGYIIKASGQKKRGGNMPTYGIGDAIRTMRIRAGYTQEELAYGICTTSTLSRIENGKSAASRQIFEALYGRMMGMHHVWLAFDTEAEMKRSKLCKQTLLYLEQRKLTEAKKVMEEYHQMMDKNNPFCMQFELYTQAIYLAVAKKKEEDILPKLEQALKITMPDSTKMIRAQKKSLLLTYDEIYILSNIGIAYAKKRETEKAFQIFYYLKGYMEIQNLDILESMKVYPMILGNFAWVLEQQGRFEEAVKHCDAGIEICHLTGKYTILPHLLCTKAWCFAASSNPGMAKKSKMQAKAILDITEAYREYGSFQELYKAREPIYVIF